MLRNRLCLYYIFVTLCPKIIAKKNQTNKQDNLFPQIKSECAFEMKQFTCYILPTKNTATNESLYSSELTGLKRIKNLRQSNHESGTYLMVSRILLKVCNSPKVFLPDKIIVTAAHSVKYDYAFYHI